MSLKISCVLLVVLCAGCCPKVIDIGTRTQGHILVVIDSDRSFNPDDIYVEVDDVVLYKATVATVLCVGPQETFGGTKYTIAAGDVLQLTVKTVPGNVDGRFITRALPGDVPDCGPGGEEGGGKVGGGGG